MLTGGDISKINRSQLKLTRREWELYLMAYLSWLISILFFFAPWVVQPQERSQAAWFVKNGILALGVLMMLLTLAVAVENSRRIRAGLPVRLLISGQGRWGPRFKYDSKPQYQNLILFAGGIGMVILALLADWK